MCRGFNNAVTTARETFGTRKAASLQDWDVYDKWKAQPHSQTFSDWPTGLEIRDDKRAIWGDKQADSETDAVTLMQMILSRGAEATPGLVDLTGNSRKQTRRQKEH